MSDTSENKRTSHKPVQIIGGDTSRPKDLKVTLSQHLDVDADGRPCNLSGRGAEETKAPGDQITVPYSDAEALLGAGYLQADPEDPAQVAAVLGR